MSILKRIYQLWRASIGADLTRLETQNAEGLLELEREELCRRVANYNRGLAGYAALCERTRLSLHKLDRERSEIGTRMQARLSVGDRASAGRHALRLEEIAGEEAALRTQLAETESTYAELTRARELALAAARERLRALQHNIRDLRTQHALAELNEVAAGMHASFDPAGSNATLERLSERIEERRTLAIGRARVAREGLAITEIRLLEADRALLGEQALRRLESGKQAS